MPVIIGTFTSSSQEGYRIPIGSRGMPWDCFPTRGIHPPMLSPGSDDIRLLQRGHVGVMLSGADDVEAKASGEVGIWIGFVTNDGFHFTDPVVIEFPLALAVFGGAARLLNEFSCPGDGLERAARQVLGETGGMRQKDAENNTRNGDGSHGSVSMCAILANLGHESRVVDVSHRAMTVKVAMVVAGIGTQGASTALRRMKLGPPGTGVARRISTFSNPPPNGVMELVVNWAGLSFQLMRSVVDSGR